MEEFVGFQVETVLKHRPQPSLVKLLATILGKIIENPDEQKYRKINSTKVLPKLRNVPGSMELLEAVGFYSDNGKFVFPAQASLDLLKVAHVALEAWLDKVPKSPAKNEAPAVPEIKSAKLLEREAQLAKVQAANAEQIKALKAKRKKQKMETQVKFEAARAEQKTKIIKASTANKLTFGRTEAGLPPPSKSKGS
eukprot:gb/GEZN01018613.1/.p1 GENE.gb/GEZN01018613.1/~~gb/GEZN01018613.1/.p1  ORF type:complete len:195 (-),score=46.69 gb/GEZN01018613.1/:137-721(-)